jgi:hypothetical protein
LDALNSIQMGATAFYLPVDDLVEQDIQRALSIRDSGRLTEWLTRADRAFSFLDAFDERPPKRSSHAEESPARVDKALGAAFGRSCIFVSCRVSDWQTTADLELLRQYFRQLDPAEGSIWQVHYIVTTVSDMLATTTGSD